MLLPEQSTDGLTTHTIPRVAWMLMCVLLVIATSVHFLIVGLWVFETDSGLSSSGEGFQTRIFALIGSLFIVVAVFSHFIMKHAMRFLVEHSNSVDKTSDKSDGSGQIGAILVPMAIRFVGTFAILGSLLFFEAVSRNEAVFDVLFWYTTLTTIETVGIVYVSRSTNERRSESDVLTH